MSTQPTIVFDLDGTLIDTAPDLMDALDAAITTVGLPIVDRDHMRPHVGMGGRAMLQKAHEINQRELDEPTMDRLLGILLEHYSGNMPGNSEPFPGLIRSMENLKSDGFQFAICTNKTETMATQLIEALGMSHWFSFVAGRDTFENHKPHPDHLIRTIEKANGSTKHAVMVGDTPSDFNAAKLANVPLVAVRFGYYDGKIEDHTPDLVIEHYDELNLKEIQSIMRL